MTPTFDPALFAPALVQVVLTAVLGLWAGLSRSRAIATGAAKGRQLREGQPNWPGHTAQVSGAFNNQFETPIYFFAGLIFAMLAGASDPIVVLLAWVYVASRLAHALVYVTVNIVPIRFSVFLVGFAACVGLWGYLAWKLWDGAA